MARKRVDGETQPGSAAHRPPAGGPLAGASPYDPPADRQRRYRSYPKLEVTSPAAKKREPLLDIPDVAAILKVSEKQVRRYIADPDPRKRLPSIKIGRLKRVEPSDLENFIRDRWQP